MPLQVPQPPVEYQHEGVGLQPAPTGQYWGSKVLQLSGPLTLHSDAELPDAVMMEDMLEAETG